jgi:predicted transposase YbfD/YdcC
VEIEQYGQAKEAWLRQFLELPYGIPSVDTFERVFAVMKPQAWQSWFGGWTEGLSLPPLAEGETDVLAFDGKTSRRSHGSGFSALHTVSVWSSQYELVIAQEQVDEKSNEITAIPKLLESINAAGAVVTTDAMGCQKNIAWLIRDQLFEDTQWLFKHADSCGWHDIPHSYAKTHEQAHGRIETRECWVLTNLDILNDQTAWRDLSALVRLRSTRTLNGKTSLEDRFFITSLSMPLDTEGAIHSESAQRIMRAVRLHWGVENGLHWRLDTAFKDDLSRARKNNAQANFVAVRHLALNVLKQDNSIKAGIETKRARASWDNSYLLKLIGL